MQAWKLIVMQWNYILLVVHYSVLVMFNDRFCFFVGCFSIYLLASPCTKREYCLCIQNPKPSFPNESTISTYMRYFHVVPTKFVCANSNFQNEFPFCVPVLLFMLDVLFSRGVFIHLSWHESVAVIRMPSLKMKKKFTLCQIINSLESVCMEGTRGYG